MSLIVTPVSPSTFTDLDEGRLDAVLTPIAPPPHLRSEVLFDEEFVCVLARSHPLRGERLSLTELASFPHASVGGMHPQQTIVTDQLDRLGAHATTEVRVPYFRAALEAVRGTRMIAVMPRRFAEHYADVAVRIAEAPSDITGFTYRLLWHPRLTDDRLHRWLRALLRDVATVPDAAGR
jgi:DNA-binding transcriptional LysR family regulator